MTSRNRHYSYTYRIENESPESSEKFIVFHELSEENGDKNGQVAAAEGGQRLKQKDPLPPIKYNLANLQVATYDIDHSRCMCPKGKYFGLNLITKNSRKVYFETFNELNICLKLILQH